MEHSLLLVPLPTGLEFRRGLDHLSPKGHCNLYGPSVSQGVDSPAQRGGGDSL